MTEIDKNIPKGNEDIHPASPRRKPVWKKVLKWLAIVVGAVIVLTGVAIAVALWYLTPERLTPLVNKYASEYLDAEFKADRIELTFWSTFPNLELKMEGMEIVSHSLRGLSAQERDLLPVDADSLMRLRELSGSVDIPGALRGKIVLSNVRLTEPWLNLVVVNDSVSNFNIVKPSEEKEQPESGSEISIDRFTIRGDFPVRYRVPADSIDVSLMFSDSELSGEGAPDYVLSVSGNTSNGFMGMPLPPLLFSADGTVTWNQKEPTKLSLTDFTFGLMGWNWHFNAALDFSDGMMLNNLDLNVERLNIGAVLPRLSNRLGGRFGEVDTDLGVQMKLRLVKPHDIASGTLPDMEVELKADATRLKYETLNLSRFNLHLFANVVGADLNKTTVEIKEFDVKGRAMDFKISGTVSTPMSDPEIEGRFSGNINFSMFPPKFRSRLPMTIAGRLHGDADVETRLSWFTPKNFHKVHVDGNLRLDDFNMAMRDGSVDSYVHRADLAFGTKSKKTYGEKSVDSLLTASLTVDTVSFNAPGLIFSGKDLSMKIATKNVRQSADTTMINPIGGAISASRLELTADSGLTRLRLTDAKVSGVLMRYNHEARQPLLNLKVDARRMGFAAEGMRGGIADGHAELTLHPRSRRPVSPRLQARIDSLAALYPQLPDDSLKRLAFRSFASRRDTVASDGRQNLDFAVDNSLKSWLRSWQLHGNLTASRAGFYTPYFPARNRLSDVDISFSTDSVVVNHTRVRTAGCDFLVDGSIRNITRSITSRRHSPIELEFNVSSDTINVNTISAMMIRGAAYAGDNEAKLAEAVVAPLEAEGDMIDQILDGAETEPEQTGPFVVPSNVDASFSMNSARVIYGDMVLRDFSGKMNIFDGAISLDKLKAATDMGEVRLNALYSAPTASDINLALSLDLKNLNLKKILEQVPQIDTLMPMLKGVEGMVSAKMAMTSAFDPDMNMDLNSVNMAVNMTGDSLVLVDSETYRTLGKWLMFKNKNRNVIDHMNVELTVTNGYLDLYPVVFDLDRYRLGVVGGNDMDFNLDYHVAVIKSPLPFKFGINIKGTPEKMKIRLGKARMNEKTVVKSQNIAESARVNLVNEMRRLFRKGVRHTGARGLHLNAPAGTKPQLETIDEKEDTLDNEATATFVEEGLIAPPEGYVPETTDDKNQKKKKKTEKR